MTRTCAVAALAAIWAPKGTPKDIVARLNGAVVSALAPLGGFSS